jgi:4-diphosphocytidyl-2C-methyl-D-erythritol kinase
MPTPAVYRKFDELNLGHSSAIRDVPDFKQWATLDAIDLMPLLVNDLERPAFTINPTLAELHQRAGKTLKRIVRMSGSGSSLFSLFDSHTEADSAAIQIRNVLKVDAIATDLCPYPLQKDISSATE